MGKQSDTSLNNGDDIASLSQAEIRTADSYGLQRQLSARQVQMIAIAGTIGTGLFLGTGVSLATGGPASMLIAYAIVGAVVWIVMLLLGEMGAQYPVAGSFTSFASRFISPAYGFALGWNYWFNDAVSLASDLTAASLVLQFWTNNGGAPGIAGREWIISIVFWVVLVTVNAISVGSYGEIEYWLASLKVITIMAFIIGGILVNVGVNTDHTYIGSSYWRLPGAPFVGGFGGFAHVFVTASFAYGGTESIGITAGETRNPSKTMPRVVKFVFWRIMIFYIVSILLIGLNVPYNYPNLSNRSSTTSPFTIVFTKAGSAAAASIINAVILSSVLSAGNHALFAGTRVLHGLASAKQAPPFFARTTRSGVPIYALALTSSISALCFASSFVGTGTLWSWLQNLVGVSNQIAWLSIGLASLRFRRAWAVQGRDPGELKYRAHWTWPWGPYFVIITVTTLIVIQGWSSFSPVFQVVDFVSYYIEIPLMVFFFFLFAVIRWTPRALAFTDLKTVNLKEDEHEEQEEDLAEDEERQKRLAGKWRVPWTLYYWLV